MTLDTQLKDNSDIWYDKSKLLSYDSLFYFALGARGTGKTFAFKKWALTKPSQTVWMRRLQEDIDDLLDKKGVKFLSDMYQEGIISPDADIKVEDDILYIDGLPKIYFVALSTSQRKKSQSYAGVNEIVFDEVFESIGVGRRQYLKKEVFLYLDFYETVNRMRALSGRPECRGIFLSNKTSWVNPYFSEWNITPFTDRFKTFEDGLIVVENYSNEKFTELKKATKFGRLINGTEYGNYAIDNDVWLDNDAFIADKPVDSIEKFDIRYEDKYIGVWIGEDSNIYCSYANNHTKKRVYGLQFECKDSEIPMYPNRFPVKDLKEVYLQGRLRFEDNTIKSIMFSIIQTGGKE